MINKDERENIVAHEFDFLEKTGPVLLLDIGSGTQDVLLARPHMEPENWPQFVLPAPARLIEQKIREITASGKHIWLYGQNMGGGFMRALTAHMQAGLQVYSTASAAVAIHDSLEKVQALGIIICEVAPPGAVPVYLTDYHGFVWENLLRQWGLPLPNMVVAAVQDHGVFPEGNRQGRMQAWAQLLQKNPLPQHWLYTHVQEECPQNTRLLALQQLTGGSVADTGTAAILGILSVAEVAKRCRREGITIINVGNSHTLAMLIYDNKVLGIFEHHTGQQPLEEYLHDLQEFRMGWLPDEKVRASGGHGVAFGERLEEAGSFAPTFIIGPQRERLRGHGQFLAPHGQMMLAGCYGLLSALGAKYTFGSVD